MQNNNTECIIKVMIILVLLLLIQYSTESIDRYVQFVRKCPTTNYTWHERSLKVQCIAPTVYHCIAALPGAGVLAELCLVTRGLKPGDGCPWIDLNKGLYEITEFFECPEKQGCPDINNAFYPSNDLYKYPACIGSYVGDIKNSKTVYQMTTDKGVNKRTTEVRETSNTSGYPSFTLDASTGTLRVRTFHLENRTITQGFSVLVMAMASLLIIAKYASRRISDPSYTRGNSTISRMENEDQEESDHYSVIPFDEIE